MLITDYNYDAYIYNVVDGDTFDAFVLLADLGFRKYEMAIERFRLKGIDVWEKVAVGGDQEHKKLGLEAKARVEELILHQWVKIKSSKDPGKYGRWLAEVIVNEEDLTDILIREGYQKDS